MSDKRLKCKHCNLYIKLFRTVLVPLNTLIYIFIYLPDYFVVGIFHGLSCKICARGPIVRVFSDVLVAFLYFDICHYRQSNLAIENPECSQPVVAGHFQ